MVSIKKWIGTFSPCISNLLFAWVCKNSWWVSVDFHVRYWEHTTGDVETKSTKSLKTERAITTSSGNYPVSCFQNLRSLACMHIMLAPSLIENWFMEIMTWFYIMFFLFIFNRPPVIVQYGFWQWNSGYAEAKYGGHTGTLQGGCGEHANRSASNLQC